MKVDRRRFIQQAGSMIALPLLPLSINKSFASTQTLRMIHNKDFAPFEYRSGNKTLGILPSICDQVFDQIPEYDLEHISLPWKRAQKLISDGKAEAISAFPSASRREYANFNKIPLTHLKTGLIYSKDNPRAKEIESISSFADLKHFSVVDVLGNGWASQMIQPHTNINWVKSFDQVFLTLDRHRYDLHVVVSLRTAQWELEQHKETMGKDLVFTPREDLSKPIPIHFGIQKTVGSNQDILTQFDTILQDFKPTYPDNLTKYVDS